MNRIEYKIDINKSKKINFLNFLYDNKASTLYEKRLVNSIYFSSFSVRVRTGCIVTGGLRIIG